MVSLSAFLHCAWNGSIVLLAYPRMVSGCKGVSTLLHVPSSICWLVFNMAMNPVLALAALGRLTEIDWKAFEYQDLFLCNYDEGDVIVAPADPPLLRSITSGAEVREGVQSEVEPRYLEKFANCGICLEYV